MTSPVLAFPLRRKGRHYTFPPVDPSDWPRNQWDSVNPEDVKGAALPSVTNILSVIDKPALMYWAAEQALRELYEAGFPKDVEDAVKAHKAACNRVAGKRADAGTRAHTLAERLTSDLPLPSSISDEDEAYADAFMSFWSDYSPEPIGVETTLYGDGYAGTADLIAKLQVNFAVEVSVVDYKTRGERDEKKLAKYGLLYDENRMQLAALARCTHIAVLEDGGWKLAPAPEITAAVGIVFFPDGSYEVEVVEDLDRCYNAFRGALALWHGIKGAI